MHRGLPWLTDPQADQHSTTDGPAAAVQGLEDPVRVAQLVADAARVVVQELEPIRVAEAVVRQVRGLGAQTAMVFTVDENRRTLELVASANVPDALAGSLKHLSFDTQLISTAAARTRRIQLVVNGGSVPSSWRMAHELLEQSGSVSVLALPLIVHDRLIGVLSWSLPFEHVFGQRELDAMESIAGVFALGLDHALRTERERRLGESLRDSERQCRVLFNNSLGLFALLAVDGEFREVNQPALTFAGLRRDAVVGRHFTRTPWWPMIVGAHQNVLDAFDAAARGVTRRLEVPIRPKERVYTLDLCFKPVFAEDGTVDMVVGEARDISEQREAEQARAQLIAVSDGARSLLQTVVDNAPCAIVIMEFDSPARVLPNPAARRLFGDTNTEGPLRVDARDMVRGPDGSPLPDEERPSMRVVKGATVSGLELLVVRPDARVPVFVSAAPLFGPCGVVTGAVMVLEDITVLKEIERLRTEWTSVIAHDLLQPANLIMFAASALRRTMDLGPGGEAIMHAVKRLNRMIRELQTASCIDARQLDMVPRPMDYAVLVRLVTGHFNEAGTRHPVRLRIDDPLPPLRGDAARLEQAITNLLSNADKYAFEGTPIDVAVERSGNSVRTSVTNVGPGIPPSDVPRLFERFHRTAAARGGPEPGLGLGLFIVRNIVEGHGGHVDVMSEPGGETTFRFTLPIAPTSPSNPTPGTPAL